MASTALRRAARMESSGTPGRVNVSWTTHALVERWFECEPRGRVAAKHKGEIEMFYVNGLRPAYRAAGDGMRGNETLTAELQALV
jgi:adenylate cyclase